MAELVKWNDVDDILYIRVRAGKIVRTDTYGDHRLVDVNANGAVIGVEFIGIDGELDLRGLPEEDLLARVIVEAGVKLPIFTTPFSVSKEPEGR